MPTPFEYAPAPESRSVVDLASSYGLFIDGEFVDGTGGSLKSINPATEELLAEVAEASAADVDRAVKAARRAYTRVWSKTSGKDRGKYLFRIARLIQERSRELAVLETPRQRQADQGVARRRHPAGRRALLLLRRLGRQARARRASAPTRGRSASPRRSSRGTSRCSCWRGRSRRRSPPATPWCSSPPRPRRSPRCSSPRSAARPTCPPGVVNIVTGAGETGRALVEHPGVDKVAFTGSTEVGKAIARAVAGTDKKLTLELGGKAANIVFDDAPIDQAVEGIVNGIFFNQGHVCCAGSRLLVQEIDRRRARRRASSAASSTLRLGDPLDKNTDIGAINSLEQLERIRHLAGVGDDEGAERWTADCDLPAQGLLVRPDGLHRRLAGAPHRARGDLRPGAVGAHLPHAERGDREGQQHPLRPVGRHLDREGLAHPQGRRARCAPASCGRTPSTGSTPPAPSAATRSPGTAARAAGTVSRPTSTWCDGGSGHGSATRGPQDLQALHRRRVPALGERPHLRGDRHQGPVPRQRRARLAQGRARRRRRRAQGAARLGQGHGVQPRAGALPRRRGDGGPPRAVRRRGRGVARGSPRVAPRPSSTPRSTAGSGTPAGPTSSRRCSAPRTPSPGPYFNFSVPEPTGVVAVVAPQESSLLGLVSVIAPVVVSGNTVRRARVRGPAAAGDHAVRGAGDLRRAGRRRQPAHRLASPRWRRGSPRTWTSTRSTSRASTTPTCAVARGRRGRQPQARAASRHRRLDRRPGPRRASGRSSRPRPSGTRSVSESAAYDAGRATGTPSSRVARATHGRQPWRGRLGRCSSPEWPNSYAHNGILLRARPRRRGAARLGRRRPRRRRARRTATSSPSATCRPRHAAGARGRRRTSSSRAVMGRPQSLGPLPAPDGVVVERVDAAVAGAFEERHVARGVACRASATTEVRDLVGRRRPPTAVGTVPLLRRARRRDRRWHAADLAVHGPAAEIDGVTTCRSHRGRGYGDALLAACVDAAADARLRARLPRGAITDDWPRTGTPAAGLTELGPPGTPPAVLPDERAPADLRGSHQSPLSARFTPRIRGYAAA